MSSIATTPATRAEPPGSTSTSAEAVPAIAKALGHAARIHVVRRQLETESCIGGDIVDEVGLARSTASEHLRILKAAGIVSGRIERARSPCARSRQPAASGRPVGGRTRKRQAGRAVRRDPQRAVARSAPLRPDLCWRAVTPGITVHHPPMCCSAGVCGPEFDPKLARLAGVTLLINWAVKPFSMAALGRLLIGHPFRPYLPAEQIDAHIAGLTILAAAPCTAMVFA